MSKNISVCAITETWMTFEDNTVVKEFFDMGYNVVHVSRLEKKGGGVGIWFKTGLDVRMVKSGLFKTFELIEVLLTCHSEKYSISTLYRTGVLDSSRKLEFLQDIENYVATKILNLEQVIIMGDFNIHVHDTNDTFAKEFIDVMKSMGFIQIVNSPTHNKGGTLDLIFVRDLACVHELNIYNESNDVPVSDHYLIEMSVLCKPKRKIQRVQKSFRDLSNINIDQFSDELSRNMYSDSEMPIEEQVKFLFSTTHSLLDKYAPLKNKSFVINNKPFTDKDINNAKRLKRQAERKYRKNGLDKHKHDLRLATRNLSKIVKIKYNEFYYKKLQAVYGNAKGTYNVINKLLNKDKKILLPEHSDPKALANNFETFFANRVENICLEMNCSLDEPQTHRNLELLENFDLVTERDLEQIIKSIKIKYSTVDEIPEKLINPVIKSTSTNILKIVNDSLQNGVFPTYLKKSHIIPVPKSSKQNVNELSDFRPIINISIISKIMEKCVFSQIFNHLENHNLLIPNQSAYRKNHSCETALIKIYNDVLSTLDSSTNVVVALLDFSAAFDTINHEILYKKLNNHFGIRGTALKWIKSFLSERLVKVKINQSFSSGRLWKHGVPQGSVLGPLLFCLYIQEIEEIINKYGLQFHIYADDIQIFCPLTSGSPELNILYNCLRDIRSWTSKNSLKLNDLKTKFIEIKTRHSNIFLGTFTILDKSFQCNSFAKNLGVLIDENLSFNNQINDVCRIGFTFIRQLWRISSKIRSVTLKTQLVYSCILSKTDYCNSLYLNLPLKQIKKLQRLLNAALRFIFNIRQRKFSSTTYLKKAHILPINLRIRFKMCVTMFRCINGLAPDYLLELVTKKISLESLRISTDTTLLHEPHFEKQNFRNRRVEISGPRQWNILPRSLREIQSLDLFKSKLKTFMFTQF